MRFSAVFDWYDDIEGLRASVDHLRRIGVEQVAVLDRGAAGDRRRREGLPSTVDHAWVIGLEDGLDEETIGSVRRTLGAALSGEWVLLTESGERWLPASGRLDRLRDLDEADELIVPRYMAALGPDGPLIVDGAEVEPNRATHLRSQPMGDLGALLEEQPAAAWSEGLLRPARMVKRRALADQRAASGRTAAGWNRVMAGDMVVAYAPYRTFEEFERGAARAFAAVSGSASVAYERLGSREDYERHVLTSGYLGRLRRRQAIRTVDELLGRPIPTFGAEPAYLAAIRAAEPWLSIAARICRADGLPFAQLEHVVTFNRPSVIVPPGRVVKFYGPWRDGVAAFDREVEAHRLLGRDQQLPVPRALANGRIDEEWRYLIVEWRPGVSLADVRDDLEDQAEARVASWLGRFVDRLHALPLTLEERQRGWQSFSDELRWRYRSARAGRDAVLPARLLAQVLEWLPPLEALMPALDEVVITHADLKAEHVIGARSPGGFRPRAVIDLGEARIAHPMYDLPVAWWSALGGDRELLSVFLHEAGLPGFGAPDFPRLALAWAMVHPSWDAVRLGDVEGVADLDELAWRLFGALGGDAQ